MGAEFLTPGPRGQCVAGKKHCEPMKKPRPVEPAGVDGERKAHAIGFAKGEMNRLTVRWKQVIASSFGQDWLPGRRPEKPDNCRLAPTRQAHKRNFSMERLGAIEVSLTAARALQRPCAGPKKVLAACIGSGCAVNVTERKL